MRRKVITFYLRKKYHQRNDERQRLIQVEAEVFIQHLKISQPMGTNKLCRKIHSNNDDYYYFLFFIYYNRFRFHS